MKILLLSLVTLSCWAAPTENSPQKCTEECSKDRYKEQGFYIKAGSGASVSTKTHIYATPSVWDPAYEGYNSGLGTAPIALAGLGYDSPFISADLTAAYRPDFTYKKYQTPIPSSTPDPLGPTTRRFNLDIYSVMISAYLNGRGFDYLNWKTWCGGSVYPVLGGGVGVSRLQLFNFRSTGLPPTAGEPLFPAFSSENQYNASYRFTYQVMAGLEYRFRDLCALSVGYRWFDVASFKGPRYFRDSNGAAFDVQNNTWKINFAANEAFIEFKVFL